MTLASCDSRKTAGENPFFTEWDTPHGVPPFDKILPEHFMPAFERGMSLHEAEIDAITSNKDEATFENTILAYDNAGQMLAQTELVFGMLCAAETNDRMQALQEQAMPLLAAHRDKIRLDDKLFVRVKEVYDRRAALGLDAEQMRLLQKTYDSFVRAGALLDAEQKARLKEINGQLSLTAVKFGNNILAENNNFVLELKSDELDGLPAGIRDAAREKAQQMGKGDKWVFTLHKPSLIPLLTYSTRRDLREKIYKAYLNRCNNGDEYDNKQLINDFIRLRTEKAHLLGYPSYAAYVVADEMAGTTDAVYGLLDQIWTPALERAKGELAEMDTLLQKDIPGATFESWDWWYYAEKVRKQKYDLNEEMLRPYLSLDNVVQGIFQLSNRLWGITFRPVSVPVYHKECIAYEVLDKDNKHLGILYFDFFPRPGKQGGAWCGAYREERYEEGKRIAPVVTIVANVSRPATPNGVALLNLDETETLFHEFGHALHSLFSQVHYAGIGGVEQDFVELPSQLMENWAFEPDMLRMYAKHYQTGDPMPDDLIEKIQRSALFNQGFTTTELLAASLSDMDIHTITEYRPIDLNAFEKEMLNGKRGLIPQIEPRYRYPYFAHIFGGGYAAGYYSYIWAEVLDKDAYEAFVESGDIFDRTTAESYRKNILERGGSEGGMELYKKFRGHEPDIKPLMIKRGLIEMPADTAARPAPLDTAARNASIRRIIGQQ